MQDLFDTLFTAARDQTGDREQNRLEDDWSLFSNKLRDKAPELVGPFDAFFDRACRHYALERRRQFLAGLRCGLGLGVAGPDEATLHADA